MLTLSITIDTVREARRSPVTRVSPLSDRRSGIWRLRS